MKIKIVGIIFLLLAFSSVQAQTLTEIEKKFGAPVKSYSVSENIWMSPEFTDDGQLCMVRLYPKKIDATTSYLDPMLSLWEVKQVFDDLAPVSFRGHKKEDFGMLISGNMVFSGFAYENVRINFTSPLFLAGNSTLNTNKTRAKEIDEFPKVTSAQIVTITWLNRKCANP